MPRIMPFRSRATRFADVSSEIAGMLKRLETRLNEEDHRWEQFGEAVAAWEAQWEANRSRILRQMGLVRGWQGDRPPMSPKRPRLNVVGLLESEVGERGA